MKRVVRQAAVFLGLFLIVGLARLPFGNYEDDIVDSVKAYGKALGIFVEIGSADLQFPLNLDLAQVSLIFPTSELPVPFYVDALHLNPNLLSLLFLRSSLDATATLYSGNLRSDIGYHFWGKTGSLTVDAEKLALDQHPVLSGFGISGTANFEAKASFAEPEDKLQPLAIDSCFLAIEITDGRYVGGHRLKGLLELPPAKDVHITAVAMTSERTVTIKSTEVLSSLGSLHGSGSIVLSEANQLKEVDLGLTIKLTNSGAEAFAAYLALAAGLPIDAPPRDWQVTILKQANQRLPITNVKPL